MVVTNGYRTTWILLHAAELKNGKNGKYPAVHILAQENKRIVNRVINGLGGLLFPGMSGIPERSPCLPGRFQFHECLVEWIRRTGIWSKEIPHLNKTPWELTSCTFHRDSVDDNHLTSVGKETFSIGPALWRPSSRLAFSNELHLGHCKTC